MIGMWRVSSRSGTSWVQYDIGRFSASADMQRVLLDVDRPVEVAPNTGQLYTPSGPNDQVAMFLRARSAVGFPQQVVGTPPALPALPQASTAPGVTP